MFRMRVLEQPLVGRFFAEGQSNGCVGKIIEEIKFLCLVYLLPNWPFTSVLNSSSMCILVNEI